MFKKFKDLNNTILNKGDFIVLNVNARIPQIYEITSEPYFNRDTWYTRVSNSESKMSLTEYQVSLGIKVDKNLKLF